MNKKGNKSERKQGMERGLQKEPIEYGVSMTSLQLTQQATSIRTNLIIKGSSDVPYQKGL